MSVVRLRGIFADVVGAVEGWAGLVGAAVQAGGMDQIDDVVERAVRSTFGEPGGLIDGAGFVSTPRAGAHVPGYVAWWVVGPGSRPIRRLELPEAHSGDRRYTRLEWWAAGIAASAGHVTGPYVDYPGSGQPAVTATAPVVVDHERVGLTAADLKIARLERVAGPLLDDIGPRATLVNDHGRVLLSADPRLSTGDLSRTDLGSLEQLCSGLWLAAGT